MREIIKFKAWDKRCSYMCYFSSKFEISDRGYCSLSFDSTKRHPPVGNGNSKRYTLLRYTGGKDKNKKDVYEGDKVIQVMPSGRVIEGIIEFSQGAFRINKGTVYMEDVVFGLCEVIGNKYEEANGKKDN